MARKKKGLCETICDWVVKYFYQIMFALIIPLLLIGLVAVYNIIRLSI